LQVLADVGGNGDARRRDLADLVSQVILRPVGAGQGCQQEDDKRGTRRHRGVSDFEVDRRPNRRSRFCSNESKRKMKIKIRKKIKSKSKRKSRKTPSYSFSCSCS